MFLTSFFTHRKRSLKLKTSIIHTCYNHLTAFCYANSLDITAVTGGRKKKGKREALKQILTAGMYALQHAYYFTFILKKCLGALVGHKQSESFYQRLTPVSVMEHNQRRHDAKIRERNIETNQDIVDTVDIYI